LAVVGVINAHVVGHNVAEVARIITTTTDGIAMDTVGTRPLSMDGHSFTDGSGN
jgi:hypothetical protein